MTEGKFFDRGESYQPVIFIMMRINSKAAELKKQQIDEEGILKTCYHTDKTI